MSSADQLLVLSAGRGIGLDGYHKLNLVLPSTSETILERYQRQLSETITIVVGYRAPELMSRYPSLSYIYNYNWFETGSAFSAALGLRETHGSVIVVPSDLILDDTAAETALGCSGNVIFTSNTENRSKNAVNVSVDQGVVSDIYSGPKRNGDDAEFKGIVRLEDPALISILVATCEENPSTSFADCLSRHQSSFRVQDIVGEVIEINAVEEYVEYFKRESSKQVHDGGVSC